MKVRSWMVFVVPLAWGTACQGSGSNSSTQATASSRPQPVPNEVTLTAEALESAGIRVGRPERRALAGGIAVPAEIQLEPSSTAHVGPLVPGRITRVAVALGDKVKRGQLLGVVASSDVSVARARLDQAHAKLAAAEATLKRQQQLASEGIGAQRALIEAEASVGELRAEVDGQKRQLSVFGSGSAGELALSSPMDGVVVAVHGTLGETISADQPAFIVTDPTKVWVRGSVPELEIEHVKSGEGALVRLHAFPDLAMKGVITYVAPGLDERTRSLLIRVSLPAPDPRLKSGLFGNIELLGENTHERGLVVPVDAIANLDGQMVVFEGTERPRSFRPRSIRLGRRSGGWVEVSSGLDENATIALSGAFVLKSVLKNDAEDSRE